MTFLKRNVSEKMSIEINILRIMSEQKNQVYFYIGWTGLQNISVNSLPRRINNVSFIMIF